MRGRLSRIPKTPCFKKFDFWAGVIINAVIDIAVLVVLYVWIKSNGGMTPW